MSYGIGLGASRYAPSRQPLRPPSPPSPLQDAIKRQLDLEDLADSSGRASPDTNGYSTTSASRQQLQQAIKRQLDLRELADSSGRASPDTNGYGTISPSRQHLEQAIKRQLDLRELADSSGRAAPHANGYSTISYNAWQPQQAASNKTAREEGATVSASGYTDRRFASGSGHDGFAEYEREYGASKEESSASWGATIQDDAAPERSSTSTSSGPPAASQNTNLWDENVAPTGRALSHSIAHDTSSSNVSQTRSAVQDLQEAFGLSDGSPSFQDLPPPAGKLVVADSESKHDSEVEDNTHQYPKDVARTYVGRESDTPSAQDGQSASATLVPTASPSTDESMKTLIEALVASQQQAQILSQTATREQNRAASLEAQLTQSQELNLKINRALTAKADLVHTHKATIEGLKRTFNTNGPLQQQLARAQAQLAKAEEENLKLSRALAAKTDAVASHKATIEDLKRKWPSQQQVSTLSKAREQLAMLQEQSLKLNQALSTKAMIVQSQKATIEDLKKKAGRNHEIAVLQSQVQSLQYALDQMSKEPADKARALRGRLISHSAQLKPFFDHDTLGSRMFVVLTDQLKEAKDEATLHAAYENFLRCMTKLFVERLSSFRNQAEAAQNASQHHALMQRAPRPSFRGFCGDNLSVTQCTHILHALTEGISKRPHEFEALLRVGSSEIINQALTDREAFLKVCRELSEDPVGRTTSLLFWQVAKGQQLRTFMQGMAKTASRLGMFG